MMEESQLDIHRLLQTMVEKEASDLHLTVGSPPALRLDGNRGSVRVEPIQWRLCLVFGSGFR